MTFTNEQREAVVTGGTAAMTIDGIDCIVVRADLYTQARTAPVDDLSHEELR